MDTLKVRVCSQRKKDLDSIISEIIRQKLVPCTFSSLDIEDYVQHMDKDLKLILANKIIKYWEEDEELFYSLIIRYNDDVDTILCLLHKDILKYFNKHQILQERTKILERLKEFEEETLNYNKRLAKLQEDINAIS